MELKHFKLEKVDSTQTFLKQEINNNEPVGNTGILVSTRRQLKGHGRKGRAWDQHFQTICFSFSLKKRENLTICSAEISVYLTQFLKRYFNFNSYIKWPNDLLDSEGNKIAGILIDVIKEEVLVGVGLNFGKQNQSTNYEFSGVDINRRLDEEDFHEIPLQITNYILKSYPLNTQDIIDKWTKHCSHINQPVVILDDEQEIKGIFKGIGEYGEALVFSEEQKLESVFNGTLRPFR